jgi:DNA-binding CsgD family transcriptional regulator
MRLSQTDLEAVLGFLSDVVPLEFDGPYPVDVVMRLQDLVRCDDAVYQDVDVRHQRFDALVGPGPDDDLDDESVYWAAGPCPITDFRIRTGDLTTVRMSDVIEARRYHELAIFREYFGPGGVDNMLDLGLPAGPARHRSFLLFREHGAADFTERDRTVLETLRPHLLGLEARAALRRRLADSAAGSEAGGRAVQSGRTAGDQLTAREREIVHLVAQGKTNAQIAAELWVAPSTVKKHLENVYGKLGVSRRTAAATLMQSLH